MLSRKEKILFAFNQSKFRDKEARIVDLETIQEASYGTTISEIRVAEVTIPSANIVGTTAGDIGATAGAPLVAAPGAGYALDFVSAVIIYDYATGAYAGGNEDLVVRVGTVAVSPAIADADLIDAVADAIIKVNALGAADYALTENATINLFSTEITAGTGAGVIRVKVAYRVITTGL